MPPARALVLLVAALAAAAAGAAAAGTAGAGTDHSATGERARFARYCLTKYAPKELGLPDAPDAEHAAFCEEAQPRYGDLVAAAQEPQPSAEVQWKRIYAADRLRAAAEERRPLLAGNAPAGLRRAPARMALAEVDAAAALPGKTEARWKQGAVPYCYGSTLSAQAVIDLSWAVLHVESGTCVRFLPRDSCASAAKKSDNYLRVGTIAGDTSCYARGGVGLQQIGEQYVNVASSGWCGQGSLAHEMLHVLGFKHMHTRLDRDSYIDVHEGRIDPDQNVQAQYEKVKAADGFKDYGSFDFGSIMMYSDGGNFRRAGETRPTMTPVAPHKWSGTSQRLALSAGDKAAVNEMYSCPKGGGGTGGNRGAKPSAAGNGGSATDATFEQLVKTTLAGAKGVRVLTLAADGKTRKITFHMVSADGENVGYFRLNNDPERKDKKRDQPDLWQWSIDAGSHWNNVPSLAHSGGWRDSTSPNLNGLLIIEELARRTGRLPNPKLDTNLASLGIKTATKSGVDTWTVTCWSENTCPDGSGRLTRQYKLVNGFWHWTAASSSTDNTFSRVAHTWKGNACACHNAANAYLLRAPGTKGSPSGRMRRGVKCKKPPTLKGERVFYVEGRGDCSFWNGSVMEMRASCSTNGDCRPNSGKGCRGQCVCGYAGWNECKCVRPVDTNTELCEDLEEGHM